MKNQLTIIILLISLVALGQNGLTKENLNPFTYSFQIEKGKITGEGATFLLQEMFKSQFTMLGEYHGSKRISEFTEAIIPEIDKYGYKTFALEIGPISANILDSTSEDIVKYLNKLNQKYLLKDDDYIDVPIPFFDYVEDAKFLKQAKNLKWNLIGIDQEYYDSFIMLSDKMYKNLSKKNQKKSEKVYISAIDSLNSYYKGNTAFSIAVKKSKTIDNFLEEMSVNDNNTVIVKAFKKSIEIYYLNDTRKYYGNNANRIKYMKENLRRELKNKNFDISKDKLLIKMGQNHLAKGFSPLALYEVGNTLSEIAAYNGNQSFNIAFMSRFSTDKGKIIDLMNSDNNYYKRSNDLRQMGKKDEWVVIDLRKLIKGHFYRPNKYRFNETIENLVKRYDVVVIPKTEVEGTLNYSLN